MRVLDIAARALVLAGTAWLLSGCSTWRTSLLNWRLGLDPASAQQAVDPGVQRQMEPLYARGAAALLNNDLDAAIAAWREYSAIAPVHLAQTKRVRGYLTLLERQAAQRFAKQAAAREGSTTYAPSDRLHVAVFPFHNPGAANANFDRALVAMITTDLVKVPALTVLERAKIDYLLQELKLGASGLMDPSTLGGPGGLLSAGTVIVGSVHSEAGPAGPGSGRYKINTAVSNVNDQRVIGTQEADGRQADFYLLQKRIVYGILDTLGIKELPASVHKVHTRSWAAYARFAAGLELLAQDRFDEARQAFYAALTFDPEFDLAREAFLNTPATGTTLEDIRQASRARP